MADVRGTLKDEEFPWFVIKQYMEVTGKECTAALQFILERWAMLDSDAERYGIRLEDFRRARDLAKVTELPRAAKNS